jgi:hypothetical protein
MNSKSRAINQALALSICIGLNSCIHDTNLQLANNVPVITSSFDTVRSALIYPDSVVDSLHVSDLNDSILIVSNGWIGSGLQLQKNLGTKIIVLSLGGTSMGTFSGCAEISDQQGANCSVPYIITKKFRETFESFPPPLWKMYNIDDTAETVKQSYISNSDATLQFIFTVDKAKPTSFPLKTGICSEFTIKEDFCCSIAFSISEFSQSGYECGFFVSTSNDTGQWSGDVGGIFLSGRNSSTEIKCKSVDGQISSATRDYLSGILWIDRKGTDMNFMYSSMGMASKDTVSTLTFDRNDSLFFHFRMVVDDLRETRSCSWNDFIIHTGKLLFQ